MAKRRYADLRFPVLGLDRSLAYQRQPPYTTPDSLNVRTQATLEQRERGGSRPAVDIAVSTQMGTGPIRMLEKVSLVETPQDSLVIGQTGFRQNTWDFVSGALPSDWEYGFSHVSGSDEFADECWGTQNNSQAQIIHEISDLDTSKTVLFGFYIRPVNDSHNATYTMYWGADPNMAAGAQFDLTLTGTEYTYTTPMGGFSSGFSSGFSTGGVTSSADPGWASPGWIFGKWQNGTVTFYYRDIELYSQSASPANYFGIGALSLSATGGTCVDGIMIQYHSTNLGNNRRNRLVALSNGVGYIQDFYNTMVPIDPDSGLTFASDKTLCAADYQQQLVIADSGQLKGGTTGRLAALTFTSFSDDDGTNFDSLGVNTEYVLTITDSDYSQNARQSVTISNADGGTWPLSYGGFSTTPVVWNVTAEDLEDALEALPGLGAGQVSVSGGFPTYIVEFTGTLAATVVGALTANALALTDSGGDTPAITINEIQQGAGGEFIAGNYQIASVSGTSLTIIDPPTVNQLADVTGIEYSIDRPAKLYDPKTDTLTILEASEGKGTVPADNPLVDVYRDRLVFAGAPSAPTSVLMSRMGDIHDWDYGATDSAGAVAIVATADAGRTPEPIVAMIPHSDECIIFGCLQSLWILRGDPGFGGAIDNISYSIGMVGPKAWTRLPTGEIVFLGQDGLYIMPAGCHGTPSSISAERIPEELKCLDPTNATVTLEWDIRNRGVYIFVTRDSRAGTYFWLDWETKSFWKESYQSDHEPYSSAMHYSPDGDCDRVYLGCRDGKLRLFEPESHVDDGGFEIASHVVLGPFRVSSNEDTEGLITEITGTIAQGSGDIAWEIRAEDSHNKVQDSAAIRASGTWQRRGLNFKAMPRVRGYAATVTLRNGQERRWALERIGVVLKDAGRLRVREEPPTEETEQGATAILLQNDAGTFLQNDAGTGLAIDMEV